MNAAPIITPRGNRITPAQYLALVQSQRMRHKDAKPCAYGHFGCAAWNAGPCSAEIAATRGDA
jgi:hypothetical protein